MTDFVVLVLTTSLTIGVLEWTIWNTWHIARQMPTRQRALAAVLGSLAGTVVLGVIFPAVLKGVLDPFPIWLVYAGLTVTAASVLGWRWPVLPRGGTGSHSGLMVMSCLLVVAVAMASIAVT